MFFPHEVLLISTLISVSLGLECYSGCGKSKCGYKMKLKYKECHDDVKYCTIYDDGEVRRYSCGMPEHTFGLSCKCNGYNDIRSNTTSNFLYCCNSNLCQPTGDVGPTNFYSYCNYIYHIECYKGRNNGQGTTGLTQTACYPLIPNTAMCSVIVDSIGRYNYDCSNKAKCPCTGWVMNADGTSEYCCQQNYCNQDPPAFDGHYCNVNETMSSTTAFVTTIPSSTTTTTSTPTTTTSTTSTPSTTTTTTRLTTSPETTNSATKTTVTTPAIITSTVTTKAMVSTTSSISTSTTTLPTSTTSGHAANSVTPAKISTTTSPTHPAVSISTKQSPSTTSSPEANAKTTTPSRIPVTLPHLTTGKHSTVSTTTQSASPVFRCYNGTGVSGTGGLIPPTAVINCSSLWCTITQPAGDEQSMVADFGCAKAAQCSERGWQPSPPLGFAVYCCKTDRCNGLDPYKGSRSASLLIIISVVLVLFI